MMFAGPTFGSSALANILGEGGLNSWPQKPLLVEVNGESWREQVQSDSLTIDDTLGEQVTCKFVAVNPLTFPLIGDRVRVLYYDQVLFSGTIHSVATSVNVTQTARLFTCECTDWSQVLVRRKVRRNFSDTTLTNILQSLLDNELLGEELTIGTIDTQATIHLVDANNATAFEVCRDMAGAAGQTFFVDFDKTIQMHSTSNPSAPGLFTEAHILSDDAQIAVDREAYRNVQTVIVTGTPAGSEDALTTTEQVRNEEQIAERAAIEGGTGIYEEIAEVEHPTSNLPADLTVFGVAYANVQLSLAGTTRTLVQCRARGYGFRAGQIATVDLPKLGASGDFVVQRVSIREASGRHLFHHLELTSSSAQQRAYESWLKIISGGSRVTVQIPGAIVHNSQSFTTPGNFNFTVPAGVTIVTLTTLGGSGGGGGGRNGTGGKGGNSGKVVSSVAVEAGQELNLVIGAKGLGGIDGPLPEDGTAGTLTSVSRTGTVLAQGDGGGGGHAYFGGGGAPGTPGGGSGAIVTVGGGKIGGAGGPHGQAGQNGKDGSALIEW